MNVQAPSRPREYLALFQPTLPTFFHIQSNFAVAHHSLLGKSVSRELLQSLNIEWDSPDAPIQKKISHDRNLQHSMQDERDQTVSDANGFLTFHTVFSVSEQSSKPDIFISSFSVFIYCWTWVSRWLQITFISSGFLRETTCKPAVGTMQFTNWRKKNMIVEKRQHPT